jgi:hypothetical protein
MAGLVDNLFGPLPPEYCLYFYFLSIFGFISLVIFVVSTFLIGVSKKKGIDFYFQSLFTALVIGIYSYFQNRLLYSMCVVK